MCVELIKVKLAASVYTLNVVNSSVMLQMLLVFLKEHKYTVMYAWRMRHMLSIV